MPNARYEPTSERVSEEQYRTGPDSDYLIYLFHIATYDFAVPFVSGRHVLDFGCGTGYGTHRIAAACASITGVDVAPEAIAFARGRYHAENLEFREVAPVESSPLPFSDGAFDTVLSFQVIEHVPDADRYLSEVRRVLQDDGVFIIATPDRTTRLFIGQRPWNRFHLVEYSPEDVLRLLARRFPSVAVNGMGSDPGFIAGEFKRSRRLKWATYPFTFPGSPERWRQFGLRTLKRGESLLHSRGTVSESSAPEGAAGGAGAVPKRDRSESLDVKAIRIAPWTTPSVNTVAVARCAPQG